MTVDQRTDVVMDLWDQLAGGHRRLSRRPEVLALLDRLVCEDERLAAQVGELHRDEQRWGGTGLHYAGTWLPTGQPVLLKLGVGREELHWMRTLAVHAPDLVPTLFASGDEIGPSPALPLGWLLSERLPSGLHPGWQGEEFSMLLEAGVRFQQVARGLPPGPVRTVDEATVRRGLEQGLASQPPGPAERLLERLRADWTWVVQACPPEVCHGDLHMANALCRTSPPAPGRAVLIDPAPALQPWAFDAAWCQVLNSIDRGRPGYRVLVQRMAAIRLARGLPACQGAELTRLAAITLGWFALWAWGLAPSRHAIPDYAAETRRYLEEAIAI